MKSSNAIMNHHRLEQIACVLDAYEMRVKFDTGVKFISGGFAHADMTSFDDEYIDIRLRWGVQSDCADTVNEELYKLSIADLDANVDVDTVVSNIKEA